MTIERFNDAIVFGDRLGANELQPYLALFFRFCSFGSLSPTSYPLPLTLASPYCAHPILSHVPEIFFYMQKRFDDYLHFHIPLLRCLL